MVDFAICVEARSEIFVALRMPTHWLLRLLRGVLFIKQCCLLRLHSLFAAWCLLQVRSILFGASHKCIPRQIVPVLLFRSLVSPCRLPSKLFVIFRVFPVVCLVILCGGTVTANTVELMKL
jgi:hypothetical protein